MSNTSILAIFAHPDDELTNGGALARYTAADMRVVLACATRGEAGEISEPHLATRETPRSLNRADPEEAVRRIAALIRAVRPEVVISHHRGGRPRHCREGRFTGSRYRGA